METYVIEAVLKNLKGEISVIKLAEKSSLEAAKEFVSERTKKYIELSLSGLSDFNSVTVVPYQITITKVLNFK